MAAAQALRRPGFLGKGGGAGQVQSAAFKPAPGQFRPPVLGAPTRPVDDGESQRLALAVAEAQKAAARFGERTAAAIAELQATAQRLAAEASTDALELGFLIARKILDMELATSEEALVGLVRTAVQRLGESRRITVHLSPGDAQSVGAILESRGNEAVAPPSTSRVEIVSDPSLGPGDCLVEGDLVTVDGRLNARLEELRRVLDGTATEDG